MGSKAPLLLVAALLLTPALAGAQQRGRLRQAPVRFPQDNIPERTPLPGAEPEKKATEGPRPADEGPGLWDTVKGTAGESIGVVRDWHRELSKHLPPIAAWAVLGVPVYLLLLLVLLARRRRRIPRVRRHEPKPARAAPAPPRSKAKTKATPTAAPPSQPEPRKEEEIPPLEHSPAEKLLLGAGVGIHEAFVVMGADEPGLTALRQAMGAAIDEVTWSAAVSSQNHELLQPVWERWIKALAAERVGSWLKDDPLVSRPGLLVGMPDLHEVSELGSVILTRPDGLGADLNDAQEGLLQQARWALQQVWQDPKPHTLMMVARRTKVPALLGDDSVEAYPLALLLHGVAALDHGGPSQGNPVDLGHEFRKALADHQELVGTPVGGEGVAVHALDAVGGGRLEGIGTIAASMAGAAFSPMAVTVKVSKIVGELDTLQQESCERLGALVNAALQDRKSGDGAAIVANIRRVLGREAAEAAAKRADALVPLAKKLSKRPLWPDAPSSTESPDLVLAQLHRTLVQHALRQCAAAEKRMFDIIEKLAFEGKAGDNRSLAGRRLGYAVACFGMALLRSTRTDLLSAGREAVSALTRG